MIAAWSVLIGALTILGAIELRKEIENEWLLGLSGLVGVLFGVGIALYPGAGVVALAFTIGAYAISEGVMLLALSWRLRSLNEALMA